MIATKDHGDTRRPTAPQASTPGLSRLPEAWATGTGGPDHGYFALPRWIRSRSPSRQRKAEQAQRELRRTSAGRKENQLVVDSLVQKFCTPK